MHRPPSCVGILVSGAGGVFVTSIDVSGECEAGDPFRQLISSVGAAARRFRRRDDLDRQIARNTVANAGHPRPAQPQRNRAATISILGDMDRCRGPRLGMKTLRKIEMRFAHLKTHHSFDRLRLRGITGARDAFHLAAIARNPQDARLPDGMKEGRKVGAWTPPHISGWIYEVVTWSVWQNASRQSGAMGDDHTGKSVAALNFGGVGSQTRRRNRFPHTMIVFCAFN
jgi:hypothetical protein